MCEYFFYAPQLLFLFLLLLLLLPHDSKCKLAEMVAVWAPLRHGHLQLNLFNQLPPLESCTFAFAGVAGCRGRGSGRGSGRDRVSSHNFNGNLYASVMNCSDSGRCRCRVAGLLHCRITNAPFLCYFFGLFFFYGNCRSRGVCVIYMQLADENCLWVLIGSRFHGPTPNLVYELDTFVCSAKG